MAQPKEAIEWIRMNQVGEAERPPTAVQRLEIPPTSERRQEQAAEAWGSLKSVPLRPSHLEDNRIVAYDGADERSLPFDMIRTRVLREMEENDWHVLAVTAPTERCGSTTTAANLAMSIARQGERPVVLVDLNLRNPRIAARLGLNRPLGVIDHLGGRASLQEVMVRAEVAGRSVFVLSAIAPSANASDLMASSRMKTLVQMLRREFAHPIVILDMPPMLSSNDTIALLPETDCTLLVLAVGHSTQAELDACRRHLEETSIVQLVLNRDRGGTAGAV